MTEQPNLFGAPTAPVPERPLPDVTRSHHGGNAESEAANERVQPLKETMRWRIVYFISKRGPQTADEIAAAWACSHNHVAPRISELKDLELVERVFAEGRLLRRPTRSGCWAQVVDVTEKARAALRHIPEFAG